MARTSTTSRPRWATQKESEYSCQKKDRKSKDVYIILTTTHPHLRDKPNKKFYDPRVFIREAEKTMSQRCKIAFDDLVSTNSL